MTFLRISFQIFILFLFVTPLFANFPKLSVNKIMKPVALKSNTMLKAPGDKNKFVHRKVKKLSSSYLVFREAPLDLKKKYDFVLSGLEYVAGFSKNSFTTAHLTGSGDTGRQVASLIRYHFENSRESSEGPKGQGVLKAKINTVKEQDHSRWSRAQQGYEHISYPALYKGIDLAIHSESGNLSYGLVGSAGADFSEVNIRVEGAKSIVIDKKGNLVVMTKRGAVLQSRPKAYEKIGNRRFEVAARFVLKGPTNFGFSVKNRYQNSTLIIDPEITFVSYIGGSESEGILRELGLDVTDNGHVLLASSTGSTDMLDNEPGEIVGSTDSFIMKIIPEILTEEVSARVVYITYYGSSGQDYATAVSGAPNGKAYFTGQAGATVPLFPGTVVDERQESSAFVVRVDRSGWPETATMVGKKALFTIKDAQFSDGSLFIGGAVNSIGAPAKEETTEHAYQRTYMGGDKDGFVGRLNPDLTQYDFLSFLGGSKADAVTGLTIQNGSLFVVGTTDSEDFPTSRYAEQPSLSTPQLSCDSATIVDRYCDDAFIASFDEEGRSLRFSTYYGTPLQDIGSNIFASGNYIAVVGTHLWVTPSTSESFLLRIGPSGTFFGVESIDGGFMRGEDIYVNNSGTYHFVGSTNNSNLSITSFHQGGIDFLYTRYSDELDLENVVYFGGSDQDQGIRIDGFGGDEELCCVLTAGVTRSGRIRTSVSLPSGEHYSGNRDLLLAGLCYGGLDPNVPEGFFIKEGPGRIEPGDSNSYSIEFDNSTDRSFTEATVTDPIDTRLRIDDVRGDSCRVDRQENIVICEADVPRGGTTIEVDFSLPGDYCSNLGEGDINPPILNIATMEHALVGSVDSNTVTTEIVCPPLDDDSVDPDACFLAEGTLCREDSRCACEQGLVCGWKSGTYCEGLLFGDFCLGVWESLNTRPKCSQEEDVDYHF